MAVLYTTSTVICFLDLNFTTGDGKQSSRHNIEKMRKLCYYINRTIVIVI